MSFPVSLIFLVLILGVAFFVFIRVSGLLLRLFLGLAVFCVAVVFLLPIRDRIPVVFPSYVEEVFSFVENAAVYGVSVLNAFLRFLGGIFGLF